MFFCKEAFHTLSSTYTMFRNASDDVLKFPHLDLFFTLQCFGWNTQAVCYCLACLRIWSWTPPLVLFKCVCVCVANRPYYTVYQQRIYRANFPLDWKSKGLCALLCRPFSSIDSVERLELVQRWLLGCQWMCSRDFVYLYSMLFTILRETPHPFKTRPEWVEWRGLLKIRAKQWASKSIPPFSILHCCR